MKVVMKLHTYSARRLATLCVCLSGGICLYGNVQAQIAPPVTNVAPPAAQSTVGLSGQVLAQPLSAESKQVVKDISKELNNTDEKPPLLSNSTANSAGITHDEFEKSLHEAENSKKIVGVAEVGASTGSIPAQRGFKGATVTCADSAVAVTDQISQSAQVTVAAAVEKCRAR